MRPIRATSSMAKRQSDLLRACVEGPASTGEDHVRRGGEFPDDACRRIGHVDLAAQAAEAVLTARLVGLKSDPLVDAAIGQMSAKLQ